MKNWKKAIAVCASAAALVSMAACGSSNAGSKSDVVARRRSASWLSARKVGSVPLTRTI